MKIYIYPLKGYVAELLLSRGVELVDEEQCDVLFYNGSNIKELRQLVKTTKCSCVVTNNIEPTIYENFFWIYHNHQDLHSLINPGIIKTNSDVLAKELYRVLSIQAEVDYKQKPERVRFDSNFRDTWNKIKKIMLWA